MGLFAPAWKSSNEAKAIKAVESLNDQSVLASAARESLHKSVRLSAINKLTDQSVLVEIAKKGDYSASDVKSFSESEYREERIAAIKKLTDQSILAEIARKKRTDFRIGVAAVEQLTDQPILVEIAKTNSLNDSIREAAIGQLTDQSILIEIAKNNYINSSIREVAFEKLSVSSDQNLLIYLIKNSRSKKTCNRVVEKLTDCSTLVEIARIEGYNYLRCQAAKRALIYVSDIEIVNEMNHIIEKCEEEMRSDSIYDTYVKGQNLS